MHLMTRKTHLTKSSEEIQHKYSQFIIVYYLVQLHCIKSLLFLILGKRLLENKVSCHEKFLIINYLVSYFIKSISFNIEKRLFENKFLIMMRICMNFRTRIENC